MKRNIYIHSIEMYHPEQKVENNFFTQYYTKDNPELGIKVSHLMEHLGRRERYLADLSKENVLTMGIAASKKLLEKNNIDPQEVDGVIFSTDTPEYTSPSNALLVSKALGLTNAHTLYDLNANCVGMIVATDQAHNLMKNNKRINKMLIIGASMIHHYGGDNPIPYACIGDAAAALLLEAVDTDAPLGFIDSLYRSNTLLSDYVKMPACGLSKCYDTQIPLSEKGWKWDSFDTTEIENRVANMIKELLKDNGYTLNDCKKIFMSQFSKKTLDNIACLLNDSSEKFKYVGDLYGYTGTSSPFLAYYHSVLEKDLNKGDVCIFCSVGSGLTANAILYIVPS